MADEKLTESQKAMLEAANGQSLPGDGLRISGAGDHRVAQTLEALGLIRVARPAGNKVRVHVTVQGRARHNAMARAIAGKP